MIIASLLSLAIALYCYAISQLQQHGQLKWISNDPYGFWGSHSHKRKYKRNGINYTKEPAFFLSTTLLVFLTDGYHMCQWMFFNFLSLSIVLAIGFNWWLFLGVLIGTRVIHWSARQILSK